MEPRKKVGPPKWIVAVVKMLTPRHQRPFIGVDLWTHDMPAQQYALRAAKAFPEIVAGQMRLELHTPLVVGEACTFLISFSGLPLPPVLALLAVTLAALSVRNGYIYPGIGSASDAFGDAVFIATIAVVAEGAFLLIAPSMVLPGRILAERILFGALTVSAWRKIFHTERADPEMERARESFNETWTMNVLWLAACIVLDLANVGAVPEVIRGRDFLLGATPLMAFGVAVRLQMEEPPGRRIERVETREEALKRELEAKRNALYARIGNQVPWYLVFEALYFVVLALPLVIALWEWMSGDPAAARVDWRQVRFNSGMLVTLSALWIYIRRLNQRVAQGFQAQMVKLQARQQGEEDDSPRTGWR